MKFVFFSFLLSFFQSNFSNQMRIIGYWKLDNQGYKRGSILFDNQNKFEITYLLDNTILDTIAIKGDYYFENDTTIMLRVTNEYLKHIITNINDSTLVIKYKKTTEVYHK